MYTLRHGGIYRDDEEIPVILIKNGEEALGERVVGLLNGGFGGLTVGMEPASTGKRYVVFMDSRHVDQQALASWSDLDPRDGDADVTFVFVDGDPHAVVRVEEE